MTLSTTTSRVDCPGNGSATIFSFAPVVIFSATDLQVTLRDASGNETSIALGAGSVNFSQSVTVFPGTGSITYPASGGSPIPTGSTLVIKRVVPILQTTALSNQGPYLAEVLETALDYDVAIVQQQQEQLNRTLQFAPSDPAVALPIPSSVVRANKVLGFDSSGNPVAAESSGTAVVSSPMIPVLSASTTDVALAALGISADMLPVIKDNYAAARGLFLKLEAGSAGAPAFPLVASATTGWYRHVSTADPISGSINTWCLVVDGNERYRFFNSVLSCNLPAGDNFGITDGSRVFHIGNDGVGYYITTTTDHMLRVGSHTALGPTIIFGDQSAGGTGFTGRFAANNFPFCFGNGGDLSIATEGVIIDTIDPPNSVIRITNSAGATARTAMAFYRSGATLVGSIVTSDVATSYVTVSDERLKTVLGPISNSGEIIDALAPFWHTWVNTPADTTHYVGLGAQSVSALVPGVVQIGVGAPGDEDYKPWAADWTKMVPLLIAELKSLRARVAALEARP